VLVGLDTASIEGPSTRMADPSNGPPPSPKVGNFSDRGWGISVIRSSALLGGRPGLVRTDTVTSQEAPLVDHVKRGGDFRWPHARTINGHRRRLLHGHGRYEPDEQAPSRAVCSMLRTAGVHLSSRLRWAAVGVHMASHCPPQPSRVAPALRWCTAHILPMAAYGTVDHWPAMVAGKPVDKSVEICLDSTKAHEIVSFLRARPKPMVAGLGFEPRTFGL
jgi:hypothetical protein